MKDYASVLRVTLPPNTVKTLSLAAADGRVENVWESGEPREGGGVHEGDGLNLLLAEGDKFLHVAHHTFAQLRSFNGVLAELVQHSPKMALDIGVTMSVSALTASLSFDAQHLEVLSERGITLDVSFYLACEEDEEN